MTDTELKKLNRTVLLEMLLEQTKEVERLRQQLAETEQKLAERKIELDKAGNIAQAALQLNDVFAAAQAAADQYVESVRMMEETTSRKCRNMEAQTRARCDGMIRQAKQETTRLWEEVRERMKDPFREHVWWLNTMRDVNAHINSDE